MRKIRIVTFPLLIFFLIALEIFSGFVLRIKEAEAAHTFDTSYQGARANTNPYTFDYTCGAGTTLFVLSIVVGGSTDRTGGVPTYNGISLTQADQNRKAPSSPETVVELWYLLNPPTGSAYQVSIPNAGARYLSPVASSYKSATGNTTAFRTANGNGGTSTNPTGPTLTGLAVGDVIVAVVGSGATTWNPTGRTGTQLYDRDDGSYGNGAQYLIKTDTNDTAMAWTFGTSDDWAIVEAAFKEELPTITISSSTAQPSSVLVGDTDIVMGSVSIERNVSSNTVTVVTLKENGGTIDAQNELANVELWLSSDDTWDSGDNRLDSAKSFDGADGECTFTETFYATTSEQYLIVRLDILSEADADDTIEVRVSTITTTDDVNGIPCDISGTSTVSLPSITVSSSIAQPTHAAAGCTDKVMGVASIVRDGGTGQVTAVTLKENNGTIDAQNELENIELWLSSDTDWDSGDEQLDSAKSFDGADGECTFTETFDVNTSTQYLIVCLDVASGATANDTIEVRISTVTTSDTVNGTPCDISGTTTVTAEWWNASWSYRKELTFDNSAQTENLTYFPVMVKLTPSRINYSDFGKGDGTDLRFIDSDNSTELKYHIEEWNSSGDSFIWVNVPQIDGSSKVDFIYMYYGNAGATDVQSSTSTFSNSYRAVWHMDEDLWNGTTNEVKDSTVNGIHGTRGGNATTVDTGKIGRCGTFDGTGDYVNLGTDMLRYTVGTLSAWANVSDSGSAARALVSVHEGIDTYDWSNLRIYQTKLQYYCRVGSAYKVAVASDETMTEGVWNYVAYATDGSGNQLYINGEPAEVTYSDGNSATNAFFGDIPASQNTKIGLIYDYNGTGVVSNEYKGTMDEVRFSTVRRSGDWIRAQYKSMSDSFITWPAFINVAPSSAQPSSVAQGCVDKVMGSVSIGKSLGSGIVTAVVLKDTGTIDAQNELSNIELWLSSNDTWDPGDNQLDTAKSFDGADGECTFNEGFVVTSSNQYLIVRLDVASGATLSDTVEIQVKSITTTDDVSGIPCDISGASSVVAPSITVASCISQPTYAVIPSTDNVMGVASIVRTGSSSTVTAMTLKENGGTIDAQNELENIELWLSSDTIWDSGDEQLSTAQSFDGADGECTFTETFDVTTTAKYLIVRLDVASGATSGDTIEIRISTITTTGSVSGIPLDFTGYTTTDNSGTLPDFTLTSSDISFSTHPHMEGQDITITAVILNDGANYASSIGVKFYDGDPDLSGSVYIDSGTISSLNSGATAQVQITWTCTYGGDHDIFVHIDRENSIGEARDNNNKAYKTITVGAANYWISDTAGNWSDAGNWSLGAKPVQGDYIVFNNLYTGKCTIDENTPELGRIIIDFGAGEIEQNGNVTITGDFIQSEGKFTCSAPQTYSFSAGGDFSIPTISDAFKRASGSGTPASPYKIYDVYGLQALPCGSDSYFELGNNIDAGLSSNWDSGKGFTPMTFTGTFDGKNHTITGVYINRPSSNSQGLFASITADATVKNLGLIDTEVHGANYTATLASLFYGTIINCYSENVQVSGSGDKVGGLVGIAQGSGASISKCYTTGSVDGTDQWQVGGLVGAAQNGAYISNSYSHASVTGGTGGVQVGGFIGSADDSTLFKCYSTGVSDGGGLCGDSILATIYYCYWDTETSGASTSEGGTGKTTAEMKQQATFVTWDFTSIWSIIQNQTYPYLQASGIVWDGGGANNNWSTGANWVGDTVPGETDNVVFNATSNKPCTINTSATVANFSIVEGSTITITASANLTVNGNFSLSTGTFNAWSTNLTIGGDWSLTTDSTFNAQTSTVTFNSLATTELTGNTTFYCLKSTQTFKTIKFSSNSITYVTGHLNFENVTLRSTLDGATWYLNLSGTQDVHDVDVKDSNASGSTINATDSTDFGNNTNWNFGPPAGANRYWVGVDNPDNWNDPNNWSDTSGETGGAGVPGPDDTAIFDGGNPNSCQIDISSTVVSVIIYSTYTATISINSGESLTTSGSFEIAGGTFTTNGEILDVGSYNQTGGIFNAGGSTVTCNGNFSVTVGTFNAGASVLVLDVTDGNATFTADGYTFNNVIFQSTGTVVRTWTLGAGTITFNGDFQLKAQGSGNLTVTAITNNPDLDIDGSVDYIGTGVGTESLSMGEGTWTVGGNVDFSDGTVDESTSTFMLNGSSTQTLTMDGNNLNILQITNSSSDGVYFTDNLTLSTFTATTGDTNLYFCGGSTFTFTNINFNGQSESSRIVLKSTSTGTAWYLTVTGNQSVSYVDVEDSDASGGNTILAIDGTSVNSGNNVKWDFGPPAAITDLTGLCDSETGDVTLSWSTPGDDGWTGTLPSGSEYIIDYSTYSIQWSTTNYKVSISTSGVAPHTEVSRTITGLTGDTTWYFQIWTRDEIPTNWSGLSNGATVWVNSVLSVSISTNTINLGVVEPGSYALTVSSVVVTNNGNIKQKFKLKIVSEPNATWGSVTATSPSAEQYRYSGIFCSTQPVTSDFLSEDSFSVSTERTSSSADLARDSDPDEQKGFNVSPDNTRNLWFKFEAPTSTDITTTQAIPVRIIAIPYP